MLKRKHGGLDEGAAVKDDPRSMPQGADGMHGGDCIVTIITGSPAAKAGCPVPPPATNDARGSSTVGGLANLLCILANVLGVRASSRPAPRMNRAVRACTGRSLCA